MPASGTPWHALEPSAIDEALGVSVEPGRGLDDAFVAARLAAIGPNAISTRPPPSFWRRLLGQLSAPLVAVLLVAAVGAFLLGETVDGLVILAVVGVNAVVGLVQEGKALAAIESLSQVLRIEASVLREGRWQRISAEQLVPG
ncbi:MAG: cation-transporting P-type ATPase, partial [Phycisphaerales bacterium]